MILRAISWLTAAAWLCMFITRIRYLEVVRRLLARGDAVLAAAAAWIWPARARASGNSWRAQPYDEVATQENHEQNR